MFVDPPRLAGRSLLPLALSLALAHGCGRKPAPTGADEIGSSAPTEATLAAQARAREAQPLDDGVDRAEAERGLVAREPSLVIEARDGSTAFDQDAYGFLQGDAPGSVHPGLWRQESIAHQHGLYRVVEGVYQLRGYDLANLTLVEGKTGWIVIDPLTSREAAERAMAFARKTLGDRPVSAVLFTHSHVDHFGGALGVVAPSDVAAGKVKVVAPEGFVEEATSENLLAGPAMGRRATYMYGRDLPRGPRARVGNGLGKEPSAGRMGIVKPTDLVGHATRSIDVDGVRFDVQYTPATEAPAELTFYLPEKKAYCAAELVSRTLHNLYTLRGAKVRDARRWAGYIDEAIERFGEAEVMFFVHNWPVFGNERVGRMLREHRDTYLYIHDQTLRLANQGLGPREIAEALTLPASLRAHHWNRGYYGTVRHDAKAVYQMYFGWYDGNPANLDPLPRVEAGRRYVEAMGGPAAVLAKGRTAYDAGDYRWAAELLGHLVASHPRERDARELLAKVFDQLGYVAESSAWRNAYLSGALELRRGTPAKGLDLTTTVELLEQTAPAELVQMLQVALNGPKAEGVALVVNFEFTDVGETWVLSIENAVLHARKAPASPAGPTLSLTRPAFARLVTGQITPASFASDKGLSVRGSIVDLARFFALLDRPNLTFPLATGPE